MFAILYNFALAYLILSWFHMELNEYIGLLLFMFTCLEITAKWSLDPQGTGTYKYSILSLVTLGDL